MIVAVTYESGNVFQHFGHTKQFQKIRQKMSGNCFNKNIVKGGDNFGNKTKS